MFPSKLFSTHRYVNNIAEESPLKYLPQSDFFFLNPNVLYF